MNEIEGIRRYIEITGFPDNPQYGMYFREASALAGKAKTAPIEMIALAFEYGRAKGCRAGKKGGRDAKTENRTVMDGIMAEVKSMSIMQRWVFLRAMKNPYFRLLAFCLADADERQSRILYRFANNLTSRKGAET